MGAALFHAKRQTDMTKLIVASRNSGKAPNIRVWISGNILFGIVMDNIRMDLQEAECGYVDWIGLAQDRDR
jgi:hypothetical protein